MKKGLAVALMVLVSSLLALGGCSAGSLEGTKGADSLHFQEAPAEGLSTDTSNSALSEGGSPSVSGVLGYDPQYDYSSGERYAEIEETGEQLVADRPEATFSLKVDTASYSNVKRYIEDGMLPPSDAVRTEELINWFGFDEPLEFSGASPFAFYTEVGPSPFNDDKRLALVRVGTREVDRSDLSPSNLVFLIDVSGSMDSYDKLPLLQEAFALLGETLGEEDRISIVTYASGTRVALAGARGSDRREIEDAIFSLAAGGSTAGERGIQEAYGLAEEFFIEGGNNRVILATDGDFNVGVSDTDELSRLISEKRQSGVYLSVLGFGTGNIRDDLMETLAKDGNGNYSYIDGRKTAEKVLVEELGSNLFTVADDVKAQVVFDPEAVRSYRLIGYENRMLSTEDFDDDRKDAGEIGAGTDVIALFEFEPAGKGAAASEGAAADSAAAGEGAAADSVAADAGVATGSHLFDVRIRYKDPGERESKLVEFPVTAGRTNRGSSSDFGFVSAVALFGDYLRTNGDGGRDAVREMTALAEDNLGADAGGYREDFVTLLYNLRSAG
ncbi:MAG: von Willebrand factor type A domain-containing protein [Coriobacteriales bacterium]|nr:von Willebrand factor type A domain-containing protein [Coriobacteriales bacterium]